MNALWSESAKREAGKWIDQIQVALDAKDEAIRDLRRELEEARRLLSEGKGGGR